MGKKELLPSPFYHHHLFSTVKRQEIKNIMMADYFLMTKVNNFVEEIFSEMLYEGEELFTHL